MDTSAMSSSAKSGGGVGGGGGGTDSDVVNLPAEKLLQLLSSKTDEEKFVGLYLLAKASPSNLEFKKNSYEAAGAQFLIRLLKTPEYRGLAASVISNFVSVPQVVELPSVLDLLPHLLRDLQEEQANIASVEDLQKSIHAICSSTAHSEKALSIIWESNGLQLLSIALCSQDQNLLKNAVLLIRDVLSYVKRSYSSALTIPLNHFSSFEHLGAHILPSLAKEFSALKTDLKMVLLECLECTISLLQKCVTSDSHSNLLHKSLNATIEDNIRLGLSHLLMSKVGDQERRHVLFVSASLMNQRGIEWAARDMHSTSNATQSSFLQLLLHRVRIEIDLHLDPNNSEAKKTAGAREQILAVCFIIVENVLVALVLQADEPEMDSGSQKAPAKGVPLQHFPKLKNVLDEIADIVIAYFSEPKDLPNPPDAISLASLRLLSVWLAEDSDAHPLLIDILPTLLTTKDPSGAVDTFAWLLPGLVHITAGSNASDKFLTASTSGSDSGLNRLREFVQSRLDRIVKLFIGSKKRTDTQILIDSEFGFSPAHQPFNLLVSLGGLIVNVLTNKPRSVSEFLPLLPPLLGAIEKLKEVTEQNRSSPLDEETPFVLMNLLVAVLYIFKCDRSRARSQYLGSEGERQFMTFATTALSQSYQNATYQSSSSLQELTALGNEAVAEIGSQIASTS